MLAKNVALPPAEPGSLHTGSRVQLFDAPHPARLLPQRRQTPQQVSALLYCLLYYMKYVHSC